MALNPWDVSKLQTMKIEEEGAYNLPTVLHAHEAERYVEDLRSFKLEEVGSKAWMEQHRRLESLNLQAHQSAMTNSDEYVVEAIVTFNKLEVLIHDLLIIEIWKENVYPLLLNRLAGRNSMRTYFILYHEATLVNLLEVLLYHKHICEMGGERILELVDYAARKMTRLVGGYDFRQIDPSAKAKMAAKDVASALEKRTPVEELTEYFTQIEFNVCLSSVAIARMICEHAEVLPLNVLSRITDTHDFLILIIPLIENPPWTRRLSNGKWQKLVDNAWKEVAPIDLLKVTKMEGQPWLAIYHLVAKQIFRERYHLNTFRKGQLLRVRKYINDMILDQLPFLADIQRYMDELALTEVPDASSLGGGVFMFQQVALMRESLIKGKDWKAIADAQFTNVFTMTDRDDTDIRAMADLYSDDTIQSVLEPTSADLKTEDE